MLGGNCGTKENGKLDNGRMRMTELGRRSRLLTYHRLSDAQESMAWRKSVSKLLAIGQWGTETIPSRARMVSGKMQSHLRSFSAHNFSNSCRRPTGVKFQREISIIVILIVIVLTGNWNPPLTNFSIATDVPGDRIPFPLFRNCIWSPYDFASWRRK